MRDEGIGIREYRAECRSIDYLGPAYGSRVFRWVAHPLGVGCEATRSSTHAFRILKRAVDFGERFLCLRHHPDEWTTHKKKALKRFLFSAFSNIELLQFNSTRPAAPSSSDLSSGQPLLCRRPWRPQFYPPAFSDRFFSATSGCFSLSAFSAAAFNLSSCA